MSRSIEACTVSKSGVAELKRCKFSVGFLTALRWKGTVEMMVLLCTVKAKIAMWYGISCSVPVDPLDNVEPNQMNVRAKTMKMSQSNMKANVRNESSAGNIYTMRSGKHEVGFSQDLNNSQVGKKIFHDFVYANYRTQVVETHY